MSADVSCQGFSSLSQPLMRDGPLRALGALGLSPDELVHFVVMTCVTSGLSVFSRHHSYVTASDARWALGLSLDEVVH